MEEQEKDEIYKMLGAVFVVAPFVGMAITWIAYGFPPKQIDVLATVGGVFILFCGVVLLWIDRKKKADAQVASG